MNLSQNSNISFFFLLNGTPVPVYSLREPILKYEVMRSIVRMMSETPLVQHERLHISITVYYEGGAMRQKVAVEHK